MSRCKASCFALSTLSGFFVVGADYYIPNSRLLSTNIQPIRSLLVSNPDRVVTSAFVYPNRTVDAAVNRGEYAGAYQLQIFPRQIHLVVFTCVQYSSVYVNSFLQFLFRSRAVLASVFLSTAIKTIPKRNGVTVSYPRQTGVFFFRGVHLLQIEPVTGKQSFFSFLRFFWYVVP